MRVHSRQSISTIVARLWGGSAAPQRPVAANHAARCAISAALGAEFVELHTGAFANNVGAEREIELARLICGAELAHSAGLKVNAGHGINYENIGDILRMPHLVELNIGHSIISRAVFSGLDAAVREMLRLMRGA